MLDHVTIGVSNLTRARKFYDYALKPLGIERLYAEGQIFSGYGADKKAVFWIGARDAVITGAHVAFTAPDRATVDALSCGCTCRWWARQRRTRAATKLSSSLLRCFCARPGWP
jgi:hypothetical protein